MLISGGVLSRLQDTNIQLLVNYLTAFRYDHVWIQSPDIPIKLLAKSRSCLLSPFWSHTTQSRALWALGIFASFFGLFLLSRQLTQNLQPCV